MGESEGLTFDLITRTSVTLYEVGWEDAFQVGVLGEGGHRRSDLEVVEGLRSCGESAQ
jgi:hypothetical protein